MKCDNVCCIYQQKGHCLLEQIEINALGMCKDCIIVALAGAALEAIKAAQRDT